MTAGVAFGASPSLFATGAGAEQRLPIGIVVVCGTLLAMFLTLLAVPAVDPARPTRVADR